MPRAKPLRSRPRAIEARAQPHAWLVVDDAELVVRQPVTPASLVRIRQMCLRMTVASARVAAPTADSCSRP